MIFLGINEFLLLPSSQSIKSFIQNAHRLEKLADNSIKKIRLSIGINSQLDYLALE